MANELMSDPVILALTVMVGAGFAALPQTLLALAALRQGRTIVEQGKENAMRVLETSALAETTKDLVADTHTQNETLIKKADEIHILTNSNLSKVTADLGLALERVAGLEKLVATLVAKPTEATHE